MVSLVTWKQTVTMRRFELKIHALPSGFRGLIFIEKHKDRAENLKLQIIIQNNDCNKITFSS
jgi:hypothetical protein